MEQQLIHIIHNEKKSNILSPEEVLKILLERGSQDTLDTFHPILKRQFKTNCRAAVIAAVLICQQNEIKPT